MKMRTHYMESSMPIFIHDTYVTETNIFIESKDTLIIYAELA